MTVTQTLGVIHGLVTDTKVVMDGARQLFILLYLHY